MPRYPRTVRWGLAEGSRSDQGGVPDTEPPSSTGSPQRTLLLPSSRVGCVVAVHPADENFATLGSRIRSGDATLLIPAEMPLV
eukprot:1058717-Rhodomonas_salina.1